MKIFNLPDLGEGLPDAEISEWYVKSGDEVTVDQPLVAMETAKAVVDIPSPQAGKIIKLFGDNGDTINTGSPLLAFAHSNDSDDATEEKKDSGTVVGKIAESTTTIDESHVITGQSRQRSIHRPQAMPRTRSLAQRLGINLNNIDTPDKPIGNNEIHQAIANAIGTPPKIESLKNIRRSMAHNMSRSHREVVPVTIFDEANIHAWSEGNDITCRLLRAIAVACQQEPALNAWYDGERMERYLHQSVNIGIAVDQGDKGLFVPVIKDIAHHNTQELRSEINHIKQQVKQGKLSEELLQGATFTLSNFGMFAGRFATPIVVPPMIAILASSAIREQLVLINDKPVNQRILPLSLSFDHRAATGGEATRFFAALIKDLQQAD